MGYKCECALGPLINSINLIFLLISQIGQATVLSRLNIGVVLLKMELCSC